MKKNILITGLPHIGKSTQLEALVMAIYDKIGFLTKEIRRDGQRVGFEVELFNGKTIPFAHVDYDEPMKVSRYGVKVENIGLALESIPESFEKETLLYVDEIGQMQLFSQAFEEKVISLLDSPNTFVATVSRVFSHEFIETVKSRNDVILVEITPDNRDRMPGFLKALLRKIEKARAYQAQPERWTVLADRVILRSEHGERTIAIRKADYEWGCDCSFFKEWNICSHYIAADSLGYL